MLFNTSTSSVSSNKLPYEFVNLSNKLASNLCKSFLFWFTSVNKCCNWSSKAFYSLLITFPNNYYSRPLYVTVKSIIVTLAESSGENAGLDNLQVKNNLNDAL